MEMKKRTTSTSSPKLRSFSSFDRKNTPLLQSASTLSLTLSDFESSPKVKASVGKCRACCKYIYDKEADTYCNRTCASWCKICLYYLIFLIFVIGIFFIFVCISNANRKAFPIIKKYNLYSGASPGLNIFPSTEGVLEPLIFIKNRTSAYTYIKKIHKFLHDSEKNCNQSISKKFKCPFSKKRLGPCGQPGYGYYEGKPCIYLKLNKLEKWLPLAYEKYPEDLPEGLKEKMMNDKQMLWVNCNGPHKFEDEYLGNITYYPEAAFDESYFPHMHGNEFNPLVAIQLSELKRGYSLLLECKLYAGNVNKYNNKARTFVYVSLT